MDRRRNEERVPEILRDAYESASDVEEPSDYALTKTIRALRKRNLLRSADGRRAGIRWTAGWIRGWRAAVLVGLGFFGGYLLGRGGSPPADTSHRVPATIADPVRGAELVQKTGTTYVLALESLANSLDRASFAEISTARAVLQSTTAAQAESVRRLLTPNEPAPTTPVDRAVVWF